MERGPDCASKLVVIKEDCVLLFNHMALEHVVHALLGDGSRSSDLIADKHSLDNPGGRPSTSSPVESPSGHDDIVHGPADINGRGLVIITMAKDEIDIVVLEVL